jgi:putative hydrolase of the HAD superfamily
MEAQGFDRASVRAKFAEIDQANLAKYGFSRLRFPQSMQDTYRHFCNDSSTPESLAILERAAAIGSTVFERKPVLAPGAREVLDQLRHTHSLFLYSVGDLEVQWMKVRELELQTSFDAIYITERKDHQQLRHILDQQGLSTETTWMVGNSLRSDINPGLRLGLNCIWVQAQSWEYDDEALLPGRVWRVSSIWQIPVVVAQVQAKHEA